MPTYRFVCEECGEIFEERMSPPEHDQNQAECPLCHTDKRVHGAPRTADAVAERRR